MSHLRERFRSDPVGRDPVQQQISSEKAAEETQIRREFEQQMSALEAESRVEFQRDLEAKIAAARSKFEAELAAGKVLSRTEMERKISQMAASERAKFEASLASQKKSLKEGYLARVKRTRAEWRRQLGLQVARAKREYAMEQRKQLPPRLIRKYRETERQVFAQALAAEAEVFEEEAKAWEQRAVGEFATGLQEWQEKELTAWQKKVGTWETKERERLEVELAASEAEAKAGLQAQIVAWKEQERKEKLEPAITEWSKQWQAKGLAERMLEWTPPDLPRWEVKLVDVPLADVGTLRIGFDIGKFFEGLAGGTAAAGAGLVASAESLAYGVGGIVGVKTPRPPPTLLGGVISAPISAAMGEPKPTAQLEELTKKPYAFTYAAATLLGDVMISLGIGKVAQKAIVQPIAKTRVGTYIGYQFKIHAPKTALRLVYGKKGAEYIVRERMPYTISAYQYTTPAGKVVTETFKIPKSVELTGRAYLKEVFAGGVTTEKFAPLVTKGARITPMKTTLRRAMEAGLKAKKGVATVYAPLRTVQLAKQIIRPEMPALAKALQFGVVPFAETLPVAAGLGVALGLKLAPEVKARAVAKPKVKAVTRLKRREIIAAIPALSEIVGVEPAEVVKQAPVQMVSPIQALVQVQALKPLLKLRLPEREEEEPKRKRKKKRVLATWEKAGVLAEYPVRKAEEVPSFIFGGLPQTTRRKGQKMDLGNVIFGSNQRKRTR